MTPTDSSRPVRTAGALEQEYRRIVVRWYPSSWTAVNGDALIGTLLDAADHRGTSSVAVRTRLDLARHGVALRAVDLLLPEVRTAMASIGAGIVTAYVLVLLLVATRRYGFGAGTAGPLAFIGASSRGAVPTLFDPGRFLALTPFLIAWLLVAAAALSRRRQLVPVALAGAVLVSVVCCPMWFNDRFTVPFSYGWASWWSNVAYLWPGSAANVVLLLTAGSTALLGRARVKPFAVAALVTAAVAVGSALFRAAVVNPYFSDWFWTPTQHSAQSVISIPFVLAGAAVVVAILARTGRQRWGLALALSALPVLLGWATELVLNPVIYIAL